MPPASTDIERAVLAFRREHAVSYLKRLSGQQPDPRTDRRARSYLRSEQALEALAAALESGAIEPSHHAALFAHIARAELEHHYEGARQATSDLLRRTVSVEGDTRALGELLGLWATQPNVGLRARLARAAGPELETFAQQLLTRRAESDRAVGALVARVAPLRHKDAGPAGGVASVAEQWLSATEPVTREALAFGHKALRVELQQGLDALWLALGQEFLGLFAREGRWRRLAADWEPLGLRRLLTARARAAADHPGPFAAPHVIVLAAPGDVRVSASAREYGLASELTGAEAVGRALGYAHASEALPTGLRFASVGTVARAAGALALQRFAEPRFLRRVRGLSGRESEVVARMSACWFLLDSRLAAAAVLARSLPPEQLDERAALAERALLSSVERGPAALLLTRFSAGAALRGKVYGPALVWALRERFDEDWYLNPRAAEPLRGALARAGDFAVEDLVQELSTSTERGVEKLGELF